MRHSCVKKGLLDERVALNVVARRSVVSTAYVRAVFSIRQHEGLMGTIGVRRSPAHQVLRTELWLPWR